MTTPGIFDKIQGFAKLELVKVGEKKSKKALSECVLSLKGKLWVDQEQKYVRFDDQNSYLA